MNKWGTYSSLFFALLLGGLLGFMVDKRSYETTVQAFQNDQELLSECLIDIIKYGNFEIEDVVLLDSKGERVILSSLISRETLIVYIPLLDCTSCADRELESLKKSAEQEHGDRVYIVSRFSNRREQKIWEKASGMRCFSVDEDVPFPNYLLSEATVTFLLDEKLRVQNYLLNTKAESGRVNILAMYYYAVFSRFRMQEEFSLLH